MDNPSTNRHEATKKVIEAAGGKLLSMYSTGADGPGVLLIFEMPDANASAAAAITGIGIAGGAIHNVTLQPVPSSCPPQGAQLHSNHRPQPQ